MRKITIILALTTLASLDSFAQNRSYYELIPYRKGKLWGYCDTLKRITISPVYEQVEWFSQHYIDRNTPGKKIAIARKGRKFGILNSDGHALVSFLYDTITRSHDVPGYILRRGKTSYRYSIDSGTITPITEENSEPEYEALRLSKINCKANEAAIAFTTNDKQMLVLLMKEVYSSDGQFSRVPRDTIYIQASEARNVECSNNSFYFRTKEGWGVMSSGGTNSGEIIIPAVYDSLYSPGSDEFVGKQRGKWAVLKPLYKSSTRPVYDSVEYKSAYYVVKRNGLWGIFQPFSNKEVLIDPVHYGDYSLTTLSANEYLVVLWDHNGRIKGYVNLNSGLKYWD